MKQGRFITIEGIEGVGKSTVMNRLATRIEEAGHTVLRTREPGGTPTAERLRDIVLGDAGEPVPPMAELLVMFAARDLHVQNVIRPALESGTWVISDRFVDASRAYQGGGRGLDMARVDTLAEWVLQDLSPDVTLLLDAPVEIAMARTMARGNPDRFDNERAEFYSRVRATYLELAERFGDRFVVVDASRPLNEVESDVDQVATRLLRQSIGKVN